MTATLPGHLSETEAAALLGYSALHLGRLRRLGVGPTFLRRGRAIFYRHADLDAWLEQSRVAAAKAAQ